MKNPIRSYLLLTYFSILFAYASAQAQTGTCVNVVTAAQYCDFLNHAATERDPGHLYNEAMTSDPTTASIARVGEPGRWYYEVIAGRENVLINYVNRQQAEASFAGRLQAAGYRLQEEANDDYLSCNSDTFEVEVSSPMLTLVSSSPTSTSNFNSYIEDVGSVVGLLGLVALCPEFITLEEFRTAAAHPDHAGAERLVVMQDAKGNDVIRAQAAGNGASASDRSQNLEIIHHLRTALRSEHSQEDANTFIRAQISPLSLTEQSSRLGIERLQYILAAADLARDQRIVAVQPLAPSGHQNNNVIPAQTISSSAQPVMPPEVKESPLFHSVLSRYLENKSLHAEECLNKLQADVSAAGKSEDARVRKSWAEVIPAAERWIQYIKNSITDSGKDRLNSYGLAAIDRAEEALRLRIEAAENIANNKVSSSLSQAAANMESAAKYTVNVLLAERSQSHDKIELAAALTHAVSHYQTAAEYRVRSKNAFADGNRQEAHRLDNEAISAQNIANKFAKAREEFAGIDRFIASNEANASKYRGQATEANSAKNTELAAALTHAAAYYQTAAEYRLQSKKAFTDGKIEEAERLNKEAKSIESDANSIEEIVKKTEQALLKEDRGLAKRCTQTINYYINKAKHINKPDVAGYWNNAALISSKAVEASANNKDDAATYYSQAAAYLEKTAIAQDRDGGEVFNALNAWVQAARYSSMVAEAVIRDQRDDKPIAALCAQVAAAYKKAAESTNKEDSVYWTEVANNTSNAALGEGSLSFLSLKKLSDAELDKQIELYRGNNIDRKKKFLQKARGLWGKAADASEKAKEIQKNNNTIFHKRAGDVFVTKRGKRKIETTQYQKISDAGAYYTQAAIYYNNAAKAENSNKSDKATYWKAVGYASTKKAEQEKTIDSYYDESDKASKNANNNKISSDKVSYWDWISCSYVSEGDLLAADDLSKKLAARYVEAAEKFKEAIKTVDNNRDSLPSALEGKRIFTKARSEESEAKASVLRENEKPPVVVQEWHDTAWAYQQSSRSYAEAATEYAQGKRVRSDILTEVGDGFFYAAENLREALTLEANGSQKMAKKWRNIAELYLKSAECFTSADESFATEKEAEGNSWRDAGISLRHAAEATREAAEIAEKCQQSAEYFILAAQAYAKLKIAEGNSWGNAGTSLYNAAENLEIKLEALQESKMERAYESEETAIRWEECSLLFAKAAKAYDEEKVEEANGWKAAADCRLNAIKMSDESREAKSKGKQDESYSLYKAAFMLDNASYKLEAKVEAVISNQTPEVVNNYDREASIYKESGDSFTLAANAAAGNKLELYKKYNNKAKVGYLFYKANESSAKAAQATGKIKEQDDYSKAEKAFEVAVKRQKKGIEAEEKGESELAEKFFEMAKFIDQHAEYYRKAAETYAREIAAKIDAEISREPYPEEKTKEIASWRNAAKYADWIKSSEEAMEAEEKGELELAEKWRQAAQLMKERSLRYAMAARQHALGYNSIGDQFDEEGGRLAKAAEEAFKIAKEATPSVAVNSAPSIDGSTESLSST